jgi:DNA-binding MarR family transcriptional regulator
MSIPMTISNLLTKAARVVGRYYQRECAPLGITPPQAGIVWVLSKAGSQTQVEIAAMLHLEKTNINAMVKKLVEGGIVELQKVPGDARKTGVCLTGRGKILSRKLQQVDERVNSHFMQLMDSERDVAVVQQFLSRVVWMSESGERTFEE